MFSSLSSLAGGLDPKLLMKLLPVIQELGSQIIPGASEAAITRALQLARLFHLGKKFLAGWEG